MFFGASRALRSVRVPFNNQDTIDALRNTVSVVIPIILFFYLGLHSIAIGIGTGTLLICLTDLPGSRSEKLTGAITSIICLFIVAVLTAFGIDHKFILPTLTALLSLLLLMMAPFGQRMAAIGTMGLVMMAFTIGLQPENPFAYGFYIALGGIWYFLVSLIQVWIFPYHSLKRALIKTRRDTAALMRLRGTGYDAEASLAGFNAANIKLHLKLTNDHELVRRLLLGDRFNIKFENKIAKRLLRQSILLIDLYEQVSALHYDYQNLRKILRASGVLELVKRGIEILVESLDGRDYSIGEFRSIVLKIESITVQADQHRELISSIGLNLNQTGELVFALDDDREIDGGLQQAQLPKFLTEGNISFKKVAVHLNFDSPILRFAIRMSILMLIIVFLIGLLPKGSYGYWLPVTLIVVSRPSYGMTMKRNMDRIIGTFLGLFIGWGLVGVEVGVEVQLGVAIIALFVFFTFLSFRYWVSAMAITLAIVLCLSVYHGNAGQILSERLLFTVLGCMIGLAATSLFPVKHAQALKTAIRNAISANKDHLSNLDHNQKTDRMGVKLARKKSYLALSALNEVISQASREPKWKRRELRALKQIELLCFQFNALTAALPMGISQTALKTKVLDTLEDCLVLLENIRHEELYSIQPLEQLQGKLELSNVADKLKCIFLNKSAN